ncbi:MAG: sulfotransferase [Desulfobacterium sp.]|nr:sulfotransferase [Desulfobacterium sp.]
MTESHILKYENNRMTDFKPNPKLVDLINHLKSMLEPVQIGINDHFLNPKLPVMLILGSPRSGTTVLTQICAASNSFAYPTNFLSRFAYAPIVGAMIQQMLFDPTFDFRNEFFDIQPLVDFNSDIGKTDGTLGISEFFHFWRRFLPNHDPGYLSNDELLKVDINRMRSELASIEAIFKKPFMSKGMMLQYNIKFFAQQVPELFFMHIKRDPLFVMQSSLQSRRKYYSRDDIWWSVKPKEYEWLSSMDVYHQVAGQVLFTEKAIDDQLSTVEEKRKLICNYESICADPNQFYLMLKSKFNDLGHPLSEYYIKENFPCGNVIRIEQNELNLLERAYDELLNTK